MECFLKNLKSGEESQEKKIRRMNHERKDFQEKREKTSEMISCDREKEKRAKGWRKKRLERRIVFSRVEESRKKESRSKRTPDDKRQVKDLMKEEETGRKEISLTLLCPQNQLHRLSLLLLLLVECLVASFTLSSLSSSSPSHSMWSKESQVSPGNHEVWDDKRERETR